MRCVAHVMERAREFDIVYDEQIHNREATGFPLAAGASIAICCSAAEPTALPADDAGGGIFATSSSTRSRKPLAERQLPTGSSI